MVDRMVFVLMGLAALTAIASSRATPPPYIECVDSSECGKDECCTIGLGRFTIPVCRRLLDIEEVCRPLHESFATSVVYPDGNSINLTNVYYNFCPCHNHLTCSGSTGTCIDLADLSDFNYLEEDSQY